MTTAVVIAGALMMLGGTMQLWSIAKVRRRQRGAILGAAVMLLDGLLAVTGVVLNGTMLGAVLIWLIAAAMWFSLWLTRRERVRQGRERA